MSNRASFEAHENMRWDTMNRRQLRTRLGKITKPEKLALFMRTALDRHEVRLYSAARHRVRELGLATNQHITRVSGQWQEAIHLVAQRGEQYEIPVGSRQAAVGGRMERLEAKTIGGGRGKGILIKEKDKKPRVRKIRFNKGERRL